MSNDDLTKPPGKSTGDYVHAAVKAGMSMVPIAGDPLVEAFQLVFGPPLERRRDEWIKSIAADLEELGKTVEGLTPQKLADDPAFVSTLIVATQVALKSHQTEKIEALRNALKNAALGRFPDFDVRAILLRFVDQLTPQHLAVLSVFDNPRAVPGLAQRMERFMAGSPSQVLEAAVPTLAGKRAIYDVIWRDLFGAGLVNTESLHVTMTGRGMLESRSTELGQTFLQFIHAPA